MDPTLNIPIQAVIAFLIVHGIQFLKNAKWFPLLKQDWTTVLKVVSAVASIATAMGITMHLTGSWESGGTVTISYPPARGLLLAFFGWMTQQMYYHGVVRPKP